MVINLSESYYTIEGGSCKFKRSGYILGEEYHNLDRACDKIRPGLFKLRQSCCRIAEYYSTIRGHYCGENFPDSIINLVKFMITPPNLWLILQQHISRKGVFNFKVDCSASYPGKLGAFKLKSYCNSEGHYDNCYQFTTISVFPRLLLLRLNENRPRAEETRCIMRNIGMDLIEVIIILGDVVIVLEEVRVNLTEISPRLGDVLNLEQVVV